MDRFSGVPGVETYDYASIQTSKLGDEPMLLLWDGAPDPSYWKDSWWEHHVAVSIDGNNNQPDGIAKYGEALSSDRDVVFYNFAMDFDMKNKAKQIIQLSSTLPWNELQDIENNGDWVLGRGPTGSGTHIHKHLRTLNYLVSGEKLWITFPLQGNENLSSYNSEAFEYGIEKSVKEWIDTTDLSMVNGLRVFTQTSGKVVYLPDNWFHIVLNTADSQCLALTFRCAEEEDNPTGLSMTPAYGLPYDLTELLETIKSDHRALKTKRETQGLTADEQSILLRLAQRGRAIKEKLRELGIR